MAVPKTTKTGIHQLVLGLFFMLQSLSLQDQPSVS